MKRLTRRTIGAAVGLCLGWLAAGMVFSPGNLSLAADAPAAHDGAAGERGHGPLDDGQKAAAGLVPQDAHGHDAEPQWFGPVVKGIVGLFVAAVVIGIPVLRAKGGDPGSLAAAHDHAHAVHDHAVGGDHAEHRHDDHAHGQAH